LGVEVLGTTITLVASLEEIDALFARLDGLLKDSEVGATLAERGVNVSLALVAKDGLLAYLHGEKARAAEDFSTFAEEVHARLSRAEKPS
jgi:hypothetical protein